MMNIEDLLRFVLEEHEDDPYTEAARSTMRLYRAFIDAGFNDKQAMTLILGFINGAATAARRDEDEEE